ncbi:hypothetical protein [Leifsonia aquatica]|uniref:hypothetical protein n=1 Tax=Leifsonia aquatica TaxID=144185 RepID=UPI00046A23B1|nr:hypothetical protein [Leifsonia aquatica]
MTASVHHLRSFRPPTGAAAIVAVLDEMTGMLERHGLPVWAGELGDATRALREGHAEGRSRVRALLDDPDGLRIVRVGFGTPAAITRWVSLCDQLAELLHPEADAARISGGGERRAPAGAPDATDEPGASEHWAPVLPLRRQA